MIKDGSSLDYGAKLQKERWIAQVARQIKLSTVIKKCHYGGDLYSYSEKLWYKYAKFNFPATAVNKEELMIINESDEITPELKNY